MGDPAINSPMGFNMETNEKVMDLHLKNLALMDQVQKMRDRLKEARYIIVNSKSSGMIKSTEWFDRKKSWLGKNKIHMINRL